MITTASHHLRGCSLMFIALPILAATSICGHRSWAHDADVSFSAGQAHHVLSGRLLLVVFHFGGYIHCPSHEAWQHACQRTSARAAAVTVLIVQPSQLVQMFSDRSLTGPSTRPVQPSIDHEGSAHQQVHAAHGKVGGFFIRVAACRCSYAWFSVMRNHCVPHGTNPAGSKRSSAQKHSHDVCGCRHYH
jgi:hypothetical protein